MKTLAALAFLGLAYGSDDHELFLHSNSKPSQRRQKHNNFPNYLFVRPPIRPVVVLQKPNPPMDRCNKEKNHEKVNSAKIQPNTIHHDDEYFAFESFNNEFYQAQSSNVQEKVKAPREVIRSIKETISKEKAQKHQENSLGSLRDLMKEVQEIKGTKLKKNKLRGYPQERVKAVQDAKDLNVPVREIVDENLFQVCYKVKGKTICYNK